MLAALALACARDPDVNDDGVVNVLDVSLVSSCLGEAPASNLQCRAADLDGDGDIDQVDLEAVAARFGETGFPVADRTPPVLTLTAPQNLAFLSEASALVTGTVDDASATVQVNGVDAPLSGTPAAFAVWVPLVEGTNRVTAVARDPFANTATATRTVTVDTSPPRVTIDSPPDGATTTAAEIAVSGMLNDIVVGTVNGSEGTVLVNGVPASIANRSYLALAVPLAPGPNLIRAEGTDRAGNAASAEVTVTRETASNAPRIAIVSGNGQQGVVGELLPEPLVVELLAGDGTPVTGQNVVFRVREGDGAVAATGPAARALVIASDALGRAQVDWRLGTRSGQGNNRVQASAVGFGGAAAFTASSLSGTPSGIVVDAGNMQTGVVGQSLPAPFVVVVVDAAGNRLAGVPVEFSVKSGGGNFDGSPTVTIPTDSNGTAGAVLALGPAEGTDNNLVYASFAGNPGVPASFLASALVAGDPADTAIRGLVLDNADVPVPGVTLSIHGTTLSTQSDAAGFFLLEGVPVGAIHLEADGGTTPRPGVWPHLEYALVTVAGRVNELGMPIYMLPIDVANEVCVDETTGGTLTLAEIPGFALEIPAGTATFPGGGRSGCVSVTAVHPDRVPMTPSFGTQPRFVVTIQPAGALFDPPAALTVPNTNAFPPGRVTEIFSFDHDLGQFVAIGTGTVSEDGSVIVADPGVGILKAGWHYTWVDPILATVGGCKRAPTGNDLIDALEQDNCVRHRWDIDSGECTSRPAPVDTPCNIGSDPIAIDFCTTGTELFRMRFDDSCDGRCQADGSCAPNAGGFRPYDIHAAACIGLRPLAEGCIPEGQLRTSMVSRLLLQGVRVRCAESVGEIALCGARNAGAYATPGSNVITLCGPGTDDVPLEEVVLHEMIHGLGDTGHEEPLDISTDRTYGCTLACGVAGPRTQAEGDASTCM